MSNVRSSVIKHGLLLCTIFFVTVLLYHGNAAADITSGKYGVNQVFDCQRSPAYPGAGMSFTASNFDLPYRDNVLTTQYQMNPGEYIQFYYPSGACNLGQVGIKRYDAGGNLIEIIATNGTIQGLENVGFLFISIPGDYGTFVSNSAGYTYGQSVTYTTTAAGDVNCATLAAYSPTTTPLATGSNYLLTINKAGTGNGTVNGAGNYASGVTANLTATADPGSVFAGWSGPSPCAASFSMPANALTCTATFDAIPTYALTVNTAGTGTGTVGGTAAGNYAAGSAVNLTATANPGSVFVGWSPSPCAASFNMPANALACTATFTIPVPTIVSVTDVKAATALATGTAAGDGITERGFFWWTDGGFTSGTVPAGSGAGNYSLTMSNLMPLTTYHVSAYIKVGGQLISSGNKISFTTTGPVLPTVITKPDFTVNGNEVLAKGEITDVGSSPVTIYGFVYAAHTAPTVWDSALPFTWDLTLPISVGKPFEGTITNLAAGKYYFRAYAHNGQGTAYGEEFSFTITGPGFAVSPTSGLITTESGGTATFTVKLNKQPTADVTVAISSSDTTEGTVSPASLIFTSENWAVPQTVTLTGADDTDIDGDQNYTVIFAAAVSDDPVYNGLKPANVAAVNIDNDALTPTDHAPTANPQTLSTDQNTALTITLTGSDPDGDTITYAVITGPQHGTLSSTAPNLTYTPAAGYSGADSFTFRTNDGKLDSVPATVSITVNPVGTGTPVYSSSPTPSITLTMSSYSPANATAILTVTNTGTAVLNITGITFAGANPTKFSVSPNTFPVSIAAGANRVFTVTGNGSTGGTFTATMAVAHNAAGSPANYTLSDVVSVYVAPNYDTGGGGSYTPPNQAPIADRLYVSAEMNKAITEVNKIPLTLYSVETQPQHGTLTGTAPNLIYTPDQGFTGTDSFMYRVWGGTAYSEPVPIQIIVRQNITEVNKAIAVKLTGTDPDSDFFTLLLRPLTYSVVTQPQHGTLTGTAPALAYTPDQGFVGTDSFTYRVYDGTAYSAPATVQIIVHQNSHVYVGDKYETDVFCAEYQGMKYGFRLNYSPSAADPSGLYWKMELATFGKAYSDSNTKGCIQVGTDLKLVIPSALFQGTLYQFTMNYHPISGDAFGLYWKLDPSTLRIR